MNLSSQNKKALYDIPVANTASVYLTSLVLAVTEFATMHCELFTLYLLLIHFTFLIHTSIVKKNGK